MFYRKCLAGLRRTRVPKSAAGQRHKRGETAKCEKVFYSKLQVWSFGYSYRSDSTGVISAARWAGYMPAVTVIKESVKIDRTIEIHETMGCGTKSGKGSVSIAVHTPIPKESPRAPLTMVSMADSAKNCRRI